MLLSNVTWSDGCTRGGNFEENVAKSPDWLISFIINMSMWEMKHGYSLQTHDKLVLLFLTSFYSDVMIQDETKLHQHVNLILVWSQAVSQRLHMRASLLHSSNKRSISIMLDLSTRHPSFHCPSSVPYFLFCLIPPSFLLTLVAFRCWDAAGRAVTTTRPVAVNWTTPFQ
jgi:hypothetical protein